MAERYSIAPQVVDPLERQIHDTIDRLIGLLNVRRGELLNLVRDKRAADRLPQQIIDQLTETQERLDRDLHNSASDCLRLARIHSQLSRLREYLNSVIHKVSNEYLMSVFMNG